MVDTGVYVARINSGSVAARESVIAVGDRVLAINDTNMELVGGVQEANNLLNQQQDVLTVTLQKSNIASFGPLSSSSRCPTSSPFLLLLFLPLPFLLSLFQVSSGVYFGDSKPTRLLFARTIWFVPLFARISHGCVEAEDV